MTTRAKILALLAERGETSSLDLVTELGNVYHLLRTMADAGEIVRRETDETFDERGGRPRIYYALP